MTMSGYPLFSVFLNIYVSHWFSPQYNHTTVWLCISYFSAAVIECPDDSEKQRCLVFIFQSRGIVHYGQEDINRRMRPGWQSRSRLITFHPHTGSKQYHQPGTQYSNILTDGGGTEFYFQIAICNITPAWQPHAELSKLLVTRDVSHVIFFHCVPMFYLVSYWGKHLQAPAQKWAEERHSNRL